MPRFIVNNHNTVAIANPIFEMRMYQAFIGESGKNDDLKQLAAANRSIFVTDDGCINVHLKEAGRTWIK